MEARTKELQHATLKRLEADVDTRFDAFRSEISTAMGTRLETLETRSKETQQALSRRLDALQTAATEDVEAVKMELASLSQVSHRLEQRQTGQDDVVRELRLQLSSRDGFREESLVATESARRDMQTQLAAMQGQLERVAVDQTTALATRESFEFRVQESYHELQQLVELLQREVASRGSHDGIREELLSINRKLGAELRAEARSLFKQEQNSIAALDEQLWLTDQRLGQRIDELVQAASRGERLAAVVAEAAHASSAHSAPHTPLATGGRDSGLGSLWREREQKHGNGISERRGRSALLSGLAAAGEAFTSYAEPISETPDEDDELEEPRAHGRGSSLAMAHKAAEIFHEIGTE